MKKKAILFSVIFFSLTYFLFAGKIGEGLRKKGIHVACLSEEDKINLQINKLEQAIRQQNIEDVLRVTSSDYSENNLVFDKKRLSASLERSFSNFAKNREFSTQVNEKVGWKVTATQDFYVRNPKIQIDENKAKVECEIGFFLTSNQITKETLTFSKVGSNWFLAESEHFFSFIENVSARISDNGHFASVFDDSPILSFTEEDFISTHSLVPTLLYIYEGTPIPRMNMTMSQQLWGFPHAAIRPFGILADVQETPGGEDFTYEFLFITDAMGNNIVATDQDEWLADFGEWGSGIGQFAGPHGICSLESFYLVADMFNNRVITYYYEKGWDDPSWDYTLTHNFNWPIDVDQKSVDQTQQPPEEVEYIAVVDHRNHRLVFFHGWPAPIGFDRAYGEYGSGVGQFIYPTSVCFGRDPETGWQTNDLFLTDDGNDRLVWLYLQDIGVDTVFWEVTYQFPVDAELTSVEVDNKGLVYVVDRHNAKVYKFAPLESYDFLLLGIWGEKGTADGQLYNPNVLTVAHARYCPYPNPCIPHPNPPGDVFVSESWGDSTGVRRFVIASDVVNLSATYVPYNEDTGEGNLIWYTYYLTDFADD
ncbi:MAG: hypothetical protein ACE5KJ_07190, partial [Candidatus Zixiibacteriota bacterium]